MDSPPKPVQRFYEWYGQGQHVQALFEPGLDAKQVGELAAFFKKHPGQLPDMLRKFAAQIGQVVKVKAEPWLPSAKSESSQRAA